jgi:S-adenosylmethionine decarboxylase
MKAKIWNYNKWLKALNEENDYKEHYDRLLKKVGFNVLNFMEHNFTPQGYTAIWLLAESHFAIHTFPEHNLHYIELSSCNNEKHNAFIKQIEYKLNLIK